MASFIPVSPNNPTRLSLPLYLPNAPTHLTLPIQSPSNTQSAVPLMKLPTTLSPAVNCFPIPLNHKHLPLHSILRHSQYMFLTQYKATSFTPIYRGKLYFFYINFYIF